MMTKENDFQFSLEVSLENLNQSGLASIEQKEQTFLSLEKTKKVISEKTHLELESDRFHASDVQSADGSKVETFILRWFVWDEVSSIRFGLYQIWEK